MEKFENHIKTKSKYKNHGKKIKRGARTLCQ